MIKYLELKRINDRYEVEIQQAIEQVLQRGWYLKGEATRQFEKRYAAFIGTKYCIGCGNGLDALTLLLRGYKEMGLLHDGDEVIVPANTFIATILAITENNLKPVFVEPDIHTLQIDDTLIEQAVTPKTRAVMIVHLYGRCAYTPRIADICHKYGLLLFEDNAQAHGCTANVQCSARPLVAYKARMFNPKEPALSETLLPIASTQERTSEHWVMLEPLPPMMRNWQMSSVHWVTMVANRSMLTTTLDVTRGWTKYRLLYLASSSTIWTKSMLEGRNLPPYI